jgi:hypothetical protein
MSLTIEGICGKERLIDSGLQSGYLGYRMKKAILKYSAGALEKLAVGSALVGLYQNQEIGLWIGAACFIVGCILSAKEAT